MEKVISKEQAEQIIRNLDLQEIIMEVTERNPCSPFHSMDCYLDLTDGSIFYRVMGYNESFRDSHFICIFSQPGNFKSEISDSEIAGDDPIPKGGVTAFPDYEDRVMNSVLYYHYEGCDPYVFIDARIDQYYFQMEYNQSLES